MGHSVQAVVDGLEGLLRQPTGCGEQTMIRMAPTVYAMQYLTHTNPNRQGVENKGYKFIEDGKIFSMSLFSSLLYDSGVFSYFIFKMQWFF